MQQEFPTRISFDRDQVQRKWQKHPELIAELKRFIDRSLEDIAGKLLAADASETELQIERLGNLIDEWIVQFNPNNALQKQVLLGRLKSKFDAVKMTEPSNRSARSKIRIMARDSAT